MQMGRAGGSKDHAATESRGSEGTVVEVSEGKVGGGGRVRRADGYEWRWLVWAAVAAVVAFVPVMIWNLWFVYEVLGLGTVIIVAGLFFLATVNVKRWKRGLSIVAMTAVYLLVSAVLLANNFPLRTNGRWMLGANGYKARVLSQPELANGELKHLEWDGWGFTVAYTVVYLVSDPTDSLAEAARSQQPVKVAGIPCEVPNVRRMEAHWYVVVFYTDEAWGNCGEAGQTAARDE